MKPQKGAKVTKNKFDIQYNQGVTSQENLIEGILHLSLYTLSFFLAGFTGFVPESYPVHPVYPVKLFALFVPFCGQFLCLYERRLNEDHVVYWKDHK